MVKISGRLVEPADDKPRSGVTLTLSSLKNSSVVLKHATYRCVTGGNGEYSFNAAPGTYAITVSVYGVEPERVGQIRVYSDSLPGDLNSFLMAPSTDDLTPEIIRLVDRMRSEVVKAAESAKQSQQVASKLASDVATHAEQVASNKVVVEQNTQIVRTKAQQVLENMQSVAANTQAVSLMRDEVVGKTSMAQAAADTATQKAASAAEHDAAAAEYARQAQEAAQATAGALIDGGAADLSTGIYPQPVQVSGAARPTFWKVTKGGTVGGVDYGVGDTLIYTVAGSGSYYKIDNTESVTSVQGEKGAVTLTPEKIGAEPAGSTAAAITQHSEKSGAHTINGVSGLAAALDAKIDSSAQLVPDGQDLIVFLRNTKTKLLRVGGAVLNAPRGWIGGDMLVIDHSANYRCVFAIGLDGICHSLAIYPNKIVGWVKQYGSNSIVGDVAQIGGVPTGAIIQTGTNGNGRYIKYADGTLVNFCQITVLPTGISQNFIASTPWPHSFIASPDHVSFTIIGTDGNGNISGIGQLNRTGFRNSSDHMMAKVSGYTYTEAISMSVILSVAGYGRWY